MRTIEKSIQLGQWVLLENVGKELDPSFEPILAQEVKKCIGNNILSFIFRLKRRDLI